VVIWRIAERCDLGCRFCRFSRELPGPRGAADPQAALRFGRLLAATGPTCW
jgi:MoaA/NifB/PqqE/SkfB family radical SAM enzyme